jgi:hypothetical protein
MDQRKARKALIADSLNDSTYSMQHLEENLVEVLKGTAADVSNCTAPSEIVKRVREQFEVFKFEISVLFTNIQHLEDDSKQNLAKIDRLRTKNAAMKSLYGARQSQTEC